MKLATATTKAKIIGYIDDFYCSNTCFIMERAPGLFSVHNSKGIINSTRVRKIEGGYIFESKENK